MCDVIGEETSKKMIWLWFPNLFSFEWLDLGHLQKRWCRAYLSRYGNGSKGKSQCDIVLVYQEQGQAMNCAEIVWTNKNDKLTEEERGEIEHIKDGRTRTISRGRMGGAFTIFQNLNQRYVGI